MAIPLATAIPLLIQAGSAIPALIPGKTERRNKKQIARLESLIGLEEFGLTEKEKAQLRGEASQKALSTLEKSAKETAALGAAYARSGAGDYLKGATIRGAEGAKIGTAIESGIQSADLQQEKEQKDELEQRYAAQDAYSQNRKQALLGLGTGLATGLVKNKLSKQTVGGTETASELDKMLQELADDLGISKDEARKRFLTV